MDRIIDITTKLSHKFTQDDAYINEEIEKHASRTLLLALTPEHICGKLVNEIYLPIVNKKIVVVRK